MSSTTHPTMSWWVSINLAMDLNKLLWKPQLCWQSSQLGCSTLDQHESGTEEGEVAGMQSLSDQSGAVHLEGNDWKGSVQSCEGSLMQHPNTYEGWQYRIPQKAGQKVGRYLD